jgi:hypothetical protein
MPTDNSARRESFALLFTPGGRLPGHSILAAIFLLLLLYPSAALQAQSISPVIVEYQGKARGSFELKNDTLFPFSVVLEPLSFSVDADGNPRYRRLDPEIRVRCSATSFRIPPKQSYTVYYEANAEQLPTWFTIYATIASGTVSQQGVRVALRLPHTVYLLPKKKFDRGSVVFLRAESIPRQKKVELELQNSGEQFARVQEVELDSASGKKTYSGFPFFPGQRRKLELDWDKAAGPSRVVLKFDKFKVSAAIKTSQ